MRHHLEYQEPARSNIGAWKFGGRDNAFKERRAITKSMGKEIAASGVMKAKTREPVRLVDVIRLAQKLAVKSADFEEAMQYSVRSLVRVLLGGDVWDWVARDGEKLNHTWSSVVWADESWYYDSPYRYAHSLHQAVENPANVAYAETHEKMGVERYTSIKPGRYLTKFFGDVLNEEQIKYWAEKQAARACPAELKFIEHNDKAGWIRVYQDGPSSCMQGEDCVEVYAHERSVLRLAYLEQGGQIMARCIVRDDKKEFVRCYPNGVTTENTRWQTAMKDAVQKEGYTPGNLMGVLLDKVDAGEGDETYKMPYLDYGQRTRGGVCVEDMGGVFKVSEYGIDAQPQCGYISLEDQMECAECGDRTHEDETVYVDNEDINICGYCYERHFITALGRRGNETVMREDDAVEVGGRYYHPDYLEHNDIYVCAYTGDHYHESEMVSTQQGMVNENDAVSLDVEDSEGNTYAYPGDEVTTHDDRVIHKDDAVTETINGEMVVFHNTDDIEAYREEHCEGEEA